ncbi:hypothetical protein [Halalkalicoccus sp. NIPERK01]|uniref:DUF7504 family protein n=1 Tax=Halalkalicoccus sp. NIPERK01 TaxID=3053469 RepID=UPI00256F0A5B|nr:hypothetical protein [Halalkalicoccus sp. NIPERK01]MDL5362066.1 hypothetical protein [Halalkalicoccus sp. NIPERK01]
MTHDPPSHSIDCRNAPTTTGERTTPGATTRGGRQRYGADDHAPRASKPDPSDGGTTSDGPSDEDGARSHAVLPPAVYREGQTVTASGPSADGVNRFLRAVYRNTPPVDGVIVLTTERSATEILRAYTEPAAGKRAGIGIVDTRSAGQYVEDVYRERPIHYTAADSDIERTALSITELVEALSTSPAQRIHLLVDSYSALCESLSREERARLLNTFHSQIDGYGIYVTDEADEVLRRGTTGAIWVEGDGDETRYRRL